MIKIICVGKIKEEYLNLMINDYTKRINKYHKLQIIEVKDSNIEEEKKEITKHIDSKYYIIALAIEGKKLNSVELANMLDKLFINYSNITFIIGGSMGIANEIKNKANYLLSFSDFTFPHGLFRAILLEQIYRSFKIINNETYHK